MPVARSSSDWYPDQYPDQYPNLDSRVEDRIQYRICHQSMPQRQTSVVMKTCVMTSHPLTHMCIVLSEVLSSQIAMFVLCRSIVGNIRDVIEEHLSVHQVSLQQQQHEPEFTTLDECFRLYTQEEMVLHLPFTSFSADIHYPYTFVLSLP